MWRTLLLVAAVVMAVAAGAEEKVCESEFKALTAAGNALIPEIDGLVPKLETEEMLANTAELARMWRLARNQQAAIELSYKELNAAFSASWRKAHNIRTIDTQDSSMLGEVFFGGEPYFVQCAGKTDTLHRAFSEAAEELHAKGVTPTVMDCAERMPSGKNIYERFFAKKNVTEPFFFVVANRDAPRSLTIKSNNVAPDSLVKYAVEATAPQVYTITDTEDFDRYCIKRKACAVMLHEAELAKDDLEMFKSVAEKKRMAVFMTVDLAKLVPSFKDALPPANGRPRLVFLRQAKKDEAEKDKKGAKSKVKWEGKAYKGKDWTAETLAVWVDDIHTGYMPLKPLKTVPNVIDPVKEQQKLREQQQQQAYAGGPTGAGPAMPPQRDTSGYGANLRYHQELARRKQREEENQAKFEAEHRAKKAGKTDANEPPRTGGFKTKKAEKPKEETAAERAERERKRREQMEKERHQADGIEFVGDEQNVEPDDEGYYHLDPIEIDDDL